MTSLRELRLGNYVKCVGGNIIKIKKDDMMCILTNTYEVDPIPLTEEILLNCGLEKLENGAFKVGKRYLFYSKLDKTWYLNASHNLAQCHNISDVDYIHELQNVYYWSSKDDYMFEREELEIEL